MYINHLVTQLLPSTRKDVIHAVTQALSQRSSMTAKRTLSETIICIITIICICIMHEEKAKSIYYLYLEGNILIIHLYHKLRGTIASCSDVISCCVIACCSEVVTCCSEVMTCSSEVLFGRECRVVGIVTLALSCQLVAEWIWFTLRQGRTTHVEYWLARWSILWGEK